MTRRHLAVQSPRDGGFGMVELLIAMFVMAVGVLATFAVLNAGLVQIRHASRVTTAAALAESQMEGFRAVKYDAIATIASEVATADSTYKGDTAYTTDGPSTTLSSPLSSTATTISLASTAGLPSGPFRLKIDNEIVYVTDTTTSPWTIQRGADCTTPASHSTGAAATQMKRVDLSVCGGTYTHPTQTLTGADNRSYRVDTYINWQLTSNASGTPGRNAKLVTLVVRDPATKRVYARVSSSFDQSTGS